jgi:hypothetical protein
MAVDGAWQGCSSQHGVDLYTCDFSYSKVEALHSDGQWYTVGPGLPAVATPGYQTCPTGDSDGDGNSDCYWGWNLGDGFTDTGYTVRVTLGAYVNPTGWGYTNGGLIYIFDGIQLATANYVNIGDSVTIKFWAEAGKPVKIYLYDKNYLEPAPGAVVGVMKASLTGTGDWREVTMATSDFVPDAGATNILDTSHVKAVALKYELSASQSGQAIGSATGHPIANAMLVWQKLSYGIFPLRYLGECLEENLFRGC